jgi:hypothetical protein
VSVAGHGRRCDLVCDLVIAVPRRGKRYAAKAPCGAPAVVRHTYYAGDLAIETKDYCTVHQHGDPQRETLAQRVVRVDL